MKSKRHYRINKNINWSNRKKDNDQIFNKDRGIYKRNNGRRYNYRTVAESTIPINKDNLMSNDPVYLPKVFDKNNIKPYIDRGQKPSKCNFQ